MKSILPIQEKINWYDCDMLDPKAVAKGINKIKPDIIYLSNTGFGHSGPWRSFPGIGRMMELTCGLSQFTGYHDEGPRRVGYAFFDPHVGWTSIFAILAALLYRHRTGKGQWIDLSMYQIGTVTCGIKVIKYILYIHVVFRS